ncbi:hypothetical protein BACCAP_04284 [Pseudoflavonifractor capillosus ATCC 29799]|uniref:Uncharacterized protein n=1 Tax=Pseudoflavonifractor capillosus ATCC 29799 TaxID=411467 RepID=A6P1B8_9FIRM|nr:hypothetical protein BACCAP_04284 [Pseudoflavonifractor capillosus ATCC 29799]
MRISSIEVSFVQIWLPGGLQYRNGQLELIILFQYEFVKSSVKQ